MPKILQIETSTDVCSVALCKNGQLLHLAETNVANSHTEQLTLLIQKCMQNAGCTYPELDAIALSDGPGSYTSLRIGAATAKGICYATGTKLITIDSLSILSQGINPSYLLEPNDVIIPMIDARRMEVYAAVYNAQKINIRPVDAIILEEDVFAQYDQNIHICGSGAEKFIQAFPKDNIKLHHTKTSAIYMTNLALDAYIQSQFSDVAYFAPSYFKAPNITKSTKKYF